jgi:hypothetical protein
VHRGEELRLAQGALAEVVGRRITVEAARKAIRSARVNPLDIDLVVVKCNLASAFARGSFHCFQAVYDAHGVLKTSINDMEAYLLASSVPSSGNGSTNPGFAGPLTHDYHLAGASPIPGLDLTAAFTTDLEGTLRTDPWSVGAYEKD